MSESSHQKRILVLTAGFGEGHNTAARNWAKAIRQLDPEAEVKVADMFRATGRVLSEALEGLYSYAITNTPRIWKLLYDFADGTKFSGQKLDLFAPLRLHLARELAAFKPDVIANTYPLYPHVLDRIRGRYDDVRVPPLYTMVTDSVSINRVWFSAASDRYLVADAESAREMEAAGVERDLITVTGFPVSPLLTELPCNLRPEDRPARILYFPCTSRRHVGRTLEQIPRCLGGVTRWTLVLGHHQRRLYHTVRKFTDANPHLDIEVLGWTDEVPSLLRTHHVIVGKAGGATVNESLTARCPMIVNYVVPGQEEGNAYLLESNGCALRITEPDGLPAAVEKILGTGGVWDAMRAAAAKLRAPHPAARAAEIVPEGAGRSPTILPAQNAV